ncbi:uncharacterized protein LOC112577179 isoform X2 [Pomacea canaliculata]|nr:uncharacterized protein LOC112577179 isoform X2 [Pomacea canaliculata]
MKEVTCYIMTREGDVLITSSVDPALLFNSSLDTGHEEDESSVDRKDDTITDTLAAAVIGVLACFVIIVLILIIRGIYRRRTRTPRREVTQITAVSADINDGFGSVGGYDSIRHVNDSISWEPVVASDTGFSSSVS